MSLRVWAEQPGRVMALVKMSPRQRFILVEGKTDERFVKRHFQRAVVETLGNRDAVADACSALEQGGVENFVGLIDADFDHVVGVNACATRIVYVSLSATEADSTIDLESTLVRTRALRQICGDLLGRRIQGFGGPAAFTKDMRESLRRATTAVGAFRAAVMSLFAEQRAVQGVGELADTDWQTFVNLDTGAVDKARLDALMQTKIRNVLKYPDIKQRARDFEDTWGSGWLLCRGHDLTHLLTLRLSHLCGRTLRVDEIEALLRDAYRGRLDNETAFGRKLKLFCNN